MAWAVLDTNVYIDHWKHGLHADALADVRRAFIVRHSSVVLSRHKRQEFQNDALIALTARRHGATVVTANVEDFQLLAKELRLSVLQV